VGRRAGLDMCGKSRPHRDSIPGPSSPYPVAIPTELPSPQKLEKEPANILTTPARSPYTMTPCIGAQRPVQNKQFFFFLAEEKLGKE
jgi:hypothetical protein